jgi:hypothetical protein
MVSKRKVRAVTVNNGRGQGTEVGAELNNIVEIARRGGSPPDTFTTTRGVVLKLSPVSDMISYRLASQRTPPKPPTVFIEAKDREEENPNDPDYLAELRRYNQDMGMLGVDVALALGVEIVRIPEGLARPDDEEWREALAFIGLESAAQGKARIIDWLKYYGTSSFAELDKIAGAIGKLSGVVDEVEVAAIEDTFRDNSERNTDTPVQSAPEVP